MARLGSRSLAALACAAGSVATLGGAGCGNASHVVPPSCIAAAQDIERALAAAPGHVALSDGTPLSQCVAQATSDGDLQNVGSVFSQVADDLATRAPHDHAAALRLGYLIGAARRGAAHNQGVSAELVRRVEQSANVPVSIPAVSAALHAGLVAGQRGG